MLLEVNDLYGGYSGKDICRGISFRIDEGELLSVLGPNGCGKTTLFRLLLGFIPFSSGNIQINGMSAASMSKKEMSRHIAYIPQSHTALFSYTVLEIVLMGRASYFSTFESPGPSDRKKALEALEKLNILHLANRKYTALSGGQRQMVLIARAICQDAKIFVMDEPSASLDYANQQLLMKVVSGLTGQGYSIIMSTHSPEHPFAVADKVLLMNQGKTAAFGTPEKAITSENLKKVYGIDMEIISVFDCCGKKHTLCMPVERVS